MSGSLRRDFAASDALFEVGHLHGPTAPSESRHGAERAFRDWRNGGDAAGLGLAAQALIEGARTGHAPSAAESELLADLLEALSLSDPARSRALAERWHASALMRGDAREQALATLQWVGEARRMAPANHESVARLERTMSLPELDEGLRARLAARVAAEHHAHPTSEARLVARRAATASLSRLRPLDALRALSTRYTDAYELVSPVERMMVYQSCARDADAAASPLVTLRARVFQLDQLLALGFSHRFDEQVAEVERLAEELKDAWNHHHLRHRRADRALFAGDFAAADTLIREGLQSRSAGPDQFCIEWWMALSVWSGAERGDPAACPPPYLQMLRNAAWLGARCTSAYYELEVGNTDAAEQIHAELKSSISSLGSVPHALANASQIAHVSFHLGCTAGTQDLLQHLLPASGGIVERNRGLCHGPVDLFIGMLLGLEGDTRGALSHLSRAVRAADAVGSPLWKARSLHAAALVCERAGGSHLREAEPYRALSRASSEQIGVRAFDSRYRASAVLLRGRPRIVLEVLASGARLVSESPEGRRTELSLGDRAADLLVTLAKPPRDANGGHVPDDEMIARIWPRRTKSRVDLNVLVHRTRRLLEREGVPLALVRHNAGTSLRVLDDALVEVKT